MVSTIRAGVYQHYKGGHYLVLGLGRCDENDEPVVVYVRLYGRAGYPMSVRTLRDFRKSVTVGSVRRPRFTYVGAREPVRVVSRTRRR